MAGCVGVSVLVLGPKDWSPQLFNRKISAVVAALRPCYDVQRFDRVNDLQYVQLF